MEILFVIVLIVVIYIIANSGQHGGQATTEHKANTNNSQYKSQQSGQVITDYKDVEREYIGRVGEEITKTIISRIKECEYTLSNLYIPTVKCETTEIDLVAFTNRGLLVLETKNYSGIIYGDENSACVPSLVLSTVHSRLEKFARPSAEVIRKHKEYVSNKY